MPARYHTILHRKQLADAEVVRLEKRLLFIARRLDAAMKNRNRLQARIEIKKARS